MRICLKNSLCEKLFLSGLFNSMCTVWPLGWEWTSLLICGLIWSVSLPQGGSVGGVLVRWGRNMYVKPAHASTRVPSTWHPSVTGWTQSLPPAPMVGNLGAGWCWEQIAVGGDKALGQQDLSEGKGALKWSFWHWKELLCVMSWGPRKVNSSRGMRRFITVCLASLQLEKEDAHQPLVGGLCCTSAPRERGRQEQRIILGWDGAGVLCGGWGELEQPWCSM